MRRAPRLPFLPAALALVLLHGLTQIAWGERIPLTEGLGTYDGRRYGEIAQDLRHELLEEGLDLFRLQRIAPSALVSVSLTLLGLPHDTAHVIRAFLVLNLALQLLLVAIWDGLAGATGLSERGRWLGFALLFVNFANLKQPYFYPVLTDTPALVLGALAVYLHLRSRGLPLLIVLLLSAFTWPALSVSGSLLYVLARRPLGESPATRGQRVLAAALGTSALLGLYGAFSRSSLGSAAAWASLLVLAAYAALVARSLLDNASLFEAGTYRGAVRSKRLAVVVALLLLIRIGLAFISTAPGMTLARHLQHVLLYNSGRPALFLIAHTVYFGPVVLLLLLLFPSVCREAHRLGLGVTAFLAFQLAHSVNAESRQLIDGLPLYVLLATRAAESAGWSGGRSWLIAALGLVGSKAWLRINQGEWGNPADFPAQYYFMSMGPSMSPLTLKLQAAAVLVALALVWLALRRRGQER